MTNEDACRFVIPFGKYLGRTLEDVATREADGPRYLDGMMGLQLREPFRTALKTFLAIPWVAEEVDRAVELRERRDYSEPAENVRKPRPWWEK